MNKVKIVQVISFQSCVSLIFLGVLCSISTVSHSQTASAGYTQGYPIVGGSVGNYTNFLVPSAMALDASQFPGAPDMCAQINSAYTSTSFTGTIDATAFSGVQECASNPFHGKNAVVHLYLNPNVVIITSVPWFTPQVTHSIEGLVAGNIGGPLTSAIVGGATIEACGPTIPAAISGVLGFSGGKCTYTGSSPGWSVNAFPDTSAAETVVMNFFMPHGPFPAGTYSCILCVGGEGNPSGPPYHPTISPPES